MSEDNSSSGHKSWMEKLTQAFAQEPKTRQELFELLREANRNKLLDNDALAIVEGAIQIADLQVRDIMIPRSQMISIKACQTPQTNFCPRLSMRHTLAIRLSAKTTMKSSAFCWLKTYCR